MSKPPSRRDRTPASDQPDVALPPEVIEAAEGMVASLKSLSSNTHIETVVIPRLYPPTVYESLTAAGHVGGGLVMVPGGVSWRGETEDLSGKAWAVLDGFVRSRTRRLSSRYLIATLWGDRPDATDQNVKDVIQEARTALRRLFQKAKASDPPKDPLRCVDHGDNLAWELTCPTT
jgi:hypothetical protein